MQCDTYPYKHLIYFLQTKERDTSANKILKTINHGNATGVERLPALPSASLKMNSKGLRGISYPLVVCQTPERLEISLGYPK